jgi:hypothetical protein
MQHNYYASPRNSFLSPKKKVFAARTKHPGARGVVKKNRPLSEDPQHYRL